MSDTKASLRRKKLAYLKTFCGDREVPHVNAEAVLDDLKKFCGVTKPGIIVSPKAGVVDPYASIYRAGQRDVFNRIAMFLGIEMTDLIKEKDHVEKAQPATAEQ